MRRPAASFFVLTWIAPFAAAGPAPESVSFQGVLRDAADAPLDGDYDMTFRLFDVPFGGTELYFDTHDAGGLGAVSVTQGLFTVAIGTGIHSNASLANVFRDHIELYVEIEVGGETLSPRVAIHSAGHALNAGNAENAAYFGGLSAGQFLRSDMDDASAGTLGAEMLESNTDLRLNAANAAVEPKLYFPYGDTEFEAELSFDPVRNAFKLNRDLSLPFTSLYVDQDIYLNPTRSFAQSTIHFNDPTSAEPETFEWDFARFRLSDDLDLFNGVVRADALWVNWRGVDSGAGSIYFWEDGDAQGEQFLWNDSRDAFVVTDEFWATGDLMTDANQVVLNQDGPNGNQDIEFYNDGPQLERFQWDATALRFEVSDDFHAFGALSADVKNFVQNHPYRDDLEIVYTSLEGNEVTTFTRGSGRLVNGEARIALEESFRFVTNPDLGLSAQLTPRAPSSGLYTESISTSELVVRSVDGEDVPFDFVVYGLRIGYEDHPVYRAKRSESFVPLPDRYRAELSAEPSLAEHTALARYRRMSGEAFGAVDADMPRAWALREAIGMRELNVDYPRGSQVSVRDQNRAAALAGEDRSDPESSTESVSSPEAASAAGLERDAEGNVYARSFRPSAGDIANIVPVGEPVEAGDVLVIDPVEPGRMRLARTAGDTAVFGVVAAEPGVVLGARAPDGTDDHRAEEVPVAVSGVVLCKVDATFGEIRAGDLLQTSPNPGHAMRAADPRIGAVLGKALEPLDAGTGVIRVLVTLR